MTETEWYAKIGDDGEIEFVAFGEQISQGLVLVDLSSKLYYDFFHRYPSFITEGLPLPVWQPETTA